MLLALVAAAQATILTKSRHGASDRWLLAVDKVVESIEKQVADAPNGVKVSMDKDSCPLYNPKDKDKAVNICIASHNEQDNSIVLEFRSPVARYELEFANIDIMDPASDIKADPYILEFKNSLNELVLDDALKQQIIDEAIKAGATEMEISDAAIAAGKITYTYKNKANTINMKITGDMVEFSSDFFQDSIDLNIPHKKFITFEIKKLAKEIFEHLYNMQRFALNDADAAAAQSTKSISCEKLMSDAEVTQAGDKRMQKNGLSFKSEGNVITISKDDKAISLSCNPVTVGTSTLVEVKADFAAVAPTIQPMTQTFMDGSLYNLVPLFASFMNDIETFAVRLLAEKNVDESFDSEGTSDTSIESN